MVRATVAMLPLGADKAQPEELVRALVEIGEFDKAEAALAELGSKFPDGKAGLLAARSFLVCKREDWKKCLTHHRPGDGRRSRRPTRSSRASRPLKNRVFRGLALMFLGKLDEAEADWTSLEAAAAASPRATAEKVAGLKRILDGMRKKAAEGRATGLIWDTVVQPKIALGVYHLFGYEKTGAPAEIRFYNLGDKPRLLRVEAQIPGVTEAAVRIVTLLAGAQREVVFLVPQLATSFSAASVRSERPAQLHLKINDGGQGPLRGHARHLDPAARLAAPLPRGRRRHHQDDARVHRRLGDARTRGRSRPSSPPPSSATRRRCSSASRPTPSRR